MQVTALAIPEVLLLTPRKLEDARGFFSETWNRQTLAGLGIAADFVQDNCSLSRQQGVVRGLHFQTPPHPQGKLIRVIRGAIFDVAVDLRRASPAYGKFVSAVLSANNWQQLWVPVGFAHGFCTIEPDTEVAYKTTGYYAPECDKGLAWDDPALAIPWPVDPSAAILADKDRRHPRLADLPDYFA